MSTAMRQKVDGVNDRIQSQLTDMRLALRGEREFGVEQVRAVSVSVQEMAPLLARAAELRNLEPELAIRLDLYKSRLRELQTTLQQINLMLLTKRAQLRTRQGQVDAMSQWAGALQQTR